ncbi:MAG TPA: hypothetical protein DCM86_01325 [Verrucomicrobiales bacterium]|nr:hypothetical protein [Verrucomicrobiales bacterium]
MKMTIRLLAIASAMTLLCGASRAADATPIEEIHAAVKKLALATNYSWSIHTENVNTNSTRKAPSPVDGKTSSEGITALVFHRPDTTLEVYLRQTNGVVKLKDQWKTLKDAAEINEPAGRNPARYLAKMATAYRTPAEDARVLMASMVKVEKVVDAIEGDLTSTATHDLIANGSRRGDNLPPGLTDPHASVKFWIKEGSVERFQYHISGSMTFGATEVKLDRLTTVEIKDVGTTKLEVPDEVKRLLAP